MSNVLTQASKQWYSRPDDQRFLSLHDMLDHFQKVRMQSTAMVCSSKKLFAIPDSDNIGLNVLLPDGKKYDPTHWAFSQLAYNAKAPAGFLRTLPSPMTADILNYKFQVAQDGVQVGVLSQDNGKQTLRAVTGPNYGRIWNEDILTSMTNRFGDGITGQWRVPGEFGKAVTVTKKNTTLYASDRDLFIFLCDETNRIEIPNRRAGESGSLARGFFVWNSEVGSSTFGLGTFLFDHVCLNRMIWGAEGYEEIRIRHTASAPDKFLEQITPALQRYSEGSAKTITNAIADARSDKFDNSDKVAEFLAKRFGKDVVQAMMKTHELEELKPVETRWDAVVAATAYAKGINHQDARVQIEREAGKILNGNN